MKVLTIVMAAIAGVGGLIVAAPADKSNHEDPAVETYEHLATAIIALRETEDGLVKGILMHYEAAAQQALKQAESQSGAARKESLEKAAEHVTSIAHEGDKPIQAIRQRLLQAGHHHHTDEDTQDDYIWIDGKEKKHFLSLAQRISKIGSQATSGDVDAVRKTLSETFARAIGTESP